MRLNELLGRRVVTSSGDEVGGIADVRLVESGTSSNPALRVDGLIVVENRLSRLFGYERHVGPALLRRLVHAWLGNAWYVPWAEVERIGDDGVTLTIGRDELRPLSEIARY
jgi:sporulation protein YlmC with PRC-barrel domain